MMKKKTLMQSVLPLIAIAITALCISFSATFARANAEPEFFIDGTAYAQTLSKNSLLEISEENKAVLGGKEYSLSTLTTYPSGKTTNADSIFLSELGEYEIKYFFNDGSQEYSIEEDFTVENTTESLFSSSENVTVKADQQVPDYILTAHERIYDEYGDRYTEEQITNFKLKPYNGTKDGVKITVHGEEAVVRFDGVIDAKEMNRNVDMLEWIITPEEYDYKNGRGVLEFVDTTIYVKFYDAMDPSISLTYQVTSYGNNRAPVGIMANDSGSCLGYGFWRNGAGRSYAVSSFCGYASDSLPQIVTNTPDPSGSATRYVTNSMHFRYDENLNTAYSFPTETIYVSHDGGYNELTYSQYPFWRKYVDRGMINRYDGSVQSEGLWNFNDYKEKNRGDEFYGFPSGAIKMEISFKGLGKNDANLMILGIGGKKINDWYADDVETKIIVDTGIAQENDLPKVIAGANSAYPVFDAIGFNYVEGILSTPTVNVYYESKENSIPVINGSFPTRKSGKYYIEYTALPYEKYGTPVTKTLVVQAVDFYDFDVTYTVNPMFKQNVLVGDKVNLYPGILNIPESQAPFFTSDVEVYFNGRKVEQYKGDMTNYFVAEKAGVYTINYVYVDYAGAKSIAKTINVNCAVADKPVLEDVAIPTALLAGRKYQFPVPSSKDGADVKVLVNGTDYTYKSFTVPSNDFTVTYTATLGGQQTTKTYDVKVLEANRFSVRDQFGYELNPFVADFFDLPSGYSLAGFSEDSIPFATTSSNETIKFINPIDVNYFKFIFFYSSQSGANDGFNVIITDSINKLQKVVLTFKEVENKTQIFVNGTLNTTIDGTFESSITALNLTMNDGFGQVYNGTDKLLVIKDFANGFEFTGFESGKVFLEFGFENVTGMSRIDIVNIAGQGVNCTMETDSGRPSFYFEKILPDYKIVGINDSIIVSIPIAYDVLSPIKDNYVEITLPNGNKIKVDRTNDDFELVFRNYGYGDYTLEYVVTDYFNRKQNVKKKFVVKDLSEPVITLSEELPTIVEVGDSLELPSATAHDEIGSSVEVKIFYTYAGSFGKLGANNTLTFTKAGKYTIYYYAVGENGNRSIITFVVEAK